jgi:hypothetical protein
MTFHTAVQQAIREVRASRDPDSADMHAALQLAIRAWQLCDQPGTIRIHWDLFGTSVHAAVEKLATAPAPVVVQLDEHHLPDNEPVRRDTAALVTTIADRLDAAAGNPAADADQRWAWSTAAARLRLAADDLTSWA